jgi:hypothetical protein
MPRLTLADLDARVLARLDGNTLLYTQSERYDIINEAYRLTNLVLGYQQTTVQLLSQQNRIYYSSPVLIILRIQFENDYLERTSINAIGRAHPQWTTATTANTGMDVSTWIPMGFTKFGIWPADSLGGGIIQVTGVSEITPLANATDSVNWGNDVLSAFDLYTGHVIQLKESPKTFSQASFDYNDYLKIIKAQTYIGGFTAPRYWVEEAQKPVGR